MAHPGPSLNPPLTTATVSQSAMHHSTISAMYHLYLVPSTRMRLIPKVVSLFPNNVVCFFRRAYRVMDIVLVTAKNGYSLWSWFAAILVQANYSLWSD